MRPLCWLVLSLAALCSCKDNKPAWTTLWRQGPPLSTIRQGVAVAEVNGFIYAMGGAIGTTFLASTEYAKIQPDGSVGPWQPGPPLNEARGYFDAEVVDGVIYVVGGGNGEAGQHLLRTVERARVGPDGKLSAWETEPNAMVIPRRCSKTVLVDRTIYAVGGFGGDMLNSVEHARVLPQGGTEEWLEEQERLTVMRYISGVKKVGDAVYVVGSHDQSTGSAVKDVEWSKVIDEGGFGPWQATAPLTTARFGLGLVSHGNRVYAIGGSSGPQFLDTIESAVVKPGGGLEPWKAAPGKLPATRSMMGTVVYKDRVYLIGGAGSNAVDYASFNDEAGELGSWLTREEKKALEEARAKAAPKAELPYGGVVLEVKHAPPWVYLMVQTSKTEGTWLAGPTGDYKVGDQVRFGGGAPMKDFYSKQLGVKFETVLFVERLQKAQ